MNRRGGGRRHGHRETRSSVVAMSIIRAITVQTRRDNNLTIRPQIDV